jgi:hypothetical protein
VWRPFGPRPFGRLVYTGDGRMIVMLGDPRRRLASGGLFEANDEEHARASRGFIAYSGSWRTRGSKVFHRVDVSLFPNWVGSTQVRTWETRGRRVSFSTRAFTVNGARQSAHLVWKRESR